MSLYTQGIKLGFSKAQGPNVGAEEGYDAEARAQLAAANAELQTALKATIKNFPDAFTADRAAYELGNAAAYGERMRAKYAGRLVDFARLIGKGINTSGLDAAVAAALTARQFWNAQKPLVGKGYEYRKGANAEWQKVRDQVVRVYVEAAGLIGQSVVLDQAGREFREDMDPTSSANLTKIAVIGAAALAAHALIVMHTTRGAR